MKQPILLRIFCNDKLEGVKQFTDSQIVIGRNTDVQLELNHESISPLHTLIEEREGGYYIVDLGSQGGTFISGHPVLDQKIESGEEFQLGSYKIQFFIGAPKPMTAPPTVPTTSPPGAPTAPPTEAPAPPSGVPTTPPPTKAPPTEAPAPPPGAAPPTEAALGPSTESTNGSSYGADNFSAGSANSPTDRGATD